MPKFVHEGTAVVLVIVLGVDLLMVMVNITIIFGIILVYKVGSLNDAIVIVLIVVSILVIDKTKIMFKVVTFVIHIVISTPKIYKLSLVLGS